MKFEGNKKFLFLTFLCMMISCISISFAIPFGKGDVSISQNKSTLLQSTFASKVMSIGQTLADNWIWIVICVGAMLFISMLIILIYVSAKKKEQIQKVEEVSETVQEKIDEIEKPETCEVAKTEPEIAEPVVAETIKEEKVEIKNSETEKKEEEKPQPNVASSSEMEKLLEKILEKLDTQKSSENVNDFRRGQPYYEYENRYDNRRVPQYMDYPPQHMPQQTQVVSDRSNYDLLLNLLLNTQQDVRDVKHQIDYLEKNEAFAKHEAQLKAISEQLNRKADTTAILLQEQKEEKLKDKIEMQQKELDENRQEKLVDKIEDRLAQKHYVEHVIDQIKVTDIIEKSAPVTQNPAPVESEKSENAKQVIVELDKHQSDLDDENEHISKDAIVIESAQKITLQEAYQQLSKTQKGYFDKLKKFASEKPNAKIKEAKTYLSIGVGNKNYVQLAIKKNIVVAYFNIESEDLMKLRLDGKTSIKTEKTKVKIVDEQSFETAKNMIELRVEQVAREIENVKSLRKEKQKQRYEQMKKKG